MQDLQGDEKSDYMPMDKNHKRKRGFTHGSSDQEYALHMSENGEPAFKKRKMEDLSLVGKPTRGFAKSLYTVQNMTETSALIPDDCEESEGRKQKR